MHFFVAYDRLCHLLVVILHRQTKKLDAQTNKKR